MRISPLFFALASLFLASSAQQATADSFSASSPDESLSTTVLLEEGRLSYRVERRGELLIASSALGYKLVDAAPLDRDFVLVRSSERSVDEPWEQVWGERRQTECRYNELRLELKQDNDTQRLMTLVFRVFNDGLGFRYEWPEQDGLKRLAISEELTEFAVDEATRAWWIPAYQREHYEYLYRHTPVTEIDVAHTPATFCSPGGTHFSLHEATLVDFSSMSLAHRGGGRLQADLAPWSDGVLVRAEAPHCSPWRTVRVSDDAAGLITNYLELNLNEPNQLDSTDWIQPGKYVGIWWEMHLNKSTWSSGPKHGATTANTKRYLDFAAKHGFDGVLVEGWNHGWDGDWTAEGDKFNFLEHHPDFDFVELSRYARERGVRIIGHNETGGAVENYENQLEEAFQLYESLGLRALKTGYVNFADGLPRTLKSGETAGEWHYGQYMVRHHAKVAEAAARYRLMLDVHEPVKQTGLRRTYPHLMTAEGARGQEYNAWSADGGNPPDHTTILPFTRLLAGPMDFTPGIFDLTYPDLRPDNRVNTTLAKQLALYVVLYSPLQMAADLPENYEQRLDDFQFIVDVPTDWEATRVLNGEIGDYVTIARKERGGDEWFLGAITDEQERSLELPLDFLDQGKTYTAEVYRDADDADWESNPAALTVEELLVDTNTVLPLRLAPGGGVAIRFRAQSDHPAQAKLSPQNKMLSPPY